MTLRAHLRGKIVAVDVNFCERLGVGVRPAREQKWGLRLGSREIMKTTITRLVSLLAALATLSVIALAAPPSATADPANGGGGWTTYPVPDAVNRNLGEIPANPGLDSLANIATSFNWARAVENSDICPGGTCEPGAVVMPTNFSFPANYASLSPSEKALHILNSERVARGLQPFEGTNATIEGVSQAWAAGMLASGNFAHNPNVITQVQNACTGCQNQIGFNAAENLYASFGFGGGYSGATYAVEEAIYSWMYVDRTLGGQGPDQNWGHRHALLWNNLSDNHGPAGSEGFIGMGVAASATSTYVVWNALDTAAAWPAPTATPGFVPLPPTRIYNSLPANLPWGPTEARNIQVTGVGGVPLTGVTGVVAHVTSVSPTADTYVTAYPAGIPRPTAASKNFGPGTDHTQITNDLLIIGIGDNGQITLYNNAGSTHLVIDVVGYYSSTGGDKYTGVAPSRIYNSLPANLPWGATETRPVQVTGQGGIPAGATAVAVHVTSVQPTADSYVTAWASGNRPLAASKNFGPGADHESITNDLLIVPLAADGSMQVYNNAGTTHLVFDVVGYFSSTGGSSPVQVPPTRIYNSINGGNPWSPTESRAIQVTGLAGVPANATVVAVHVTSVFPNADSYLTAYATGGARPLAASKNFGNGPDHTSTSNDLLLVPIGQNGQITLYNNAGHTHLVVDVVGYI